MNQTENYAKTTDLENQLRSLGLEGERVVSSTDVSSGVRHPMSAQDDIVRSHTEAKPEISRVTGGFSATLNRTMLKFKKKRFYVALVLSFGVFVLLAATRPKQLRKKGELDEYGSLKPHTFNWTMAAGIALLIGLLVVIIPMFIKK